MAARCLSTCDALAEALNYSMVGGKRIRAMLVHAACTFALGDPKKSLSAACAVEFVHNYSLIHDDLPAMDNGVLRRGRPCCHKKFGEALAILVGDSLQAFAFEILSTFPLLSVEIRLQQITTLAKAIGCQGMVQGQSLDMGIHTMHHDPMTLEMLKNMHIKKTGMLISASLEMGARAARASISAQEVLSIYGKSIGLAFQVQDDILDAVGDSAQMGKVVGTDMIQNKVTFVSLMGVEGAGRYLQSLLEQAQNVLMPFKEEADPLRWLARFIVDRRV